MLKNRLVAIIAFLAVGYQLSSSLAGQPASGAVSNLTEGQFSYDAKGKRNPFIPLVTSDGKIINLDTEANSNKGIILEGIIYDKNGISYAILNGSVVKVGDFVGDVQVLKVEKKKVILIKDGQTSEVKLKEEEE